MNQTDVDAPSTGPTAEEQRAKQVELVSDAILAKEAGWIAALRNRIASRIGLMGSEDPHRRAREIWLDNRVEYIAEQVATHNQILKALGALIERGVNAQENTAQNSANLGEAFNRMVEEIQKANEMQAEALKDLRDPDGDEPWKNDE